MVNLRVRDLKGMVEQLRGAGIEVTSEMWDTEAGSFVRILLEKHDLHTRLNGPPPLIGLDHPGDTFEQGGLARAIAPDQREPVAPADEQVEAAEQPAGALDEAEIFISENGCGHERGR